MTARTITTAADLAALGNASVVPEAAVEAARTAARLHSTTEPPPHENHEVCCGECGEAIAYHGCTAEETSERAWRHAYRAALTAALPLLTSAPSATRDEVARSIPVDALATFITGHGGDFETGQWRVELAFPLSEPVSVDSWRQDLIDAITPKEDR